MSVADAESGALSPDTKAILLLTAPLLAGGGTDAPPLLGRDEYQALARRLHRMARRPADLLGPDGEGVVDACASAVDAGRLRRLLNRGFQLGQAAGHWQARGIWVVSRADPGYPRTLRVRLREDAPPLLYGCGPPSVLETGGLAIVGSRDASQLVLAYAQAMGRDAALAGQTVVSGGARGVDAYAMSGALNAGGTVVGVLSCNLGRMALDRGNRTPLHEGRLALVSPYDPAAGFNVGHAMGRNKLVYALSDVALVVNSDHGRGGTWAGAVEQLDRLRLVPVHVRMPGKNGEDKGLEALLARGALLWPPAPDAGGDPHPPPVPEVFPPDVVSDAPTPAATVFSAVRHVVPGLLTRPMTEADIAAALEVSPSQARLWLQRLVDERILDRTKAGYAARPGAGEEQARLL